MDLTIRPYADSDAAGVADLMNDVEVHFGGHPGFTGDEIRSMTHDVRDPELDTRVIAAPDGSIVAYATVRVPPADSQRASITGTVHPRWRGRGLGRELVSWQLERIDQLHREVAPGAEWMARTGAHQDDAAAREMLTRLGFAPIRYWFDMTASLTDRRARGIDDVAPTVSVHHHDLDFASVDAADLPALHDAHIAAFADHFGFEWSGFDDWTRSTVGSEHFRPDLSRIAYDGEQIVAYVLSYDEAQPDTVYIGQVGTRPAWRRRGLAGLLLGDVLAAGTKDGKRAARLNVDATNATGAVGVYERLGFVTGVCWVSYAKPMPPIAMSRIPAESAAVPGADIVTDVRNDVVIRSFADGDAQAIADMLNDIERLAGATPGFTANEIHEEVADLRDVALDTRVVTATDGAVIAYGLVEPPPDGGFRASIYGSVAPSWRGRGLGREMFAWQQDRVAALHREVAPASDWIAETGAYLTETDAIDLFERSGFEVRRYWFEMEASTAGATPMKVGDFRTETAETVDAHALFEAHQDAFRDHFGFQVHSFDEFHRHTLASADFRPELSRIVYTGSGNGSDNGSGDGSGNGPDPEGDREDADQIIAYVLCYDVAQADRMYIGQVGTRRRWRGRGIASALLSEILAAAAAAGRTNAHLGVDATNPTGAVGIYERVGFAVKTRSVSYAKSVPA